MSMKPLPVLSGGGFRVSEQSARATGIARPGTRILIVDDEVDLLEMLAAYFVEYKYDVATATNGADALIVVSRQRPDVVLLDIHMPRTNGVETLKEIMKIDQSIPVIMVTGNLELNATIEAVRNGAFAYVPKPFDLRYLDHLIAVSLSPGRRR
jgi:DNA-binding NtrC family response regulator